MSPCPSVSNALRPGFTVFGLLGCGTLAAFLLLILLPVYENAKDKATLRATLADMEMWGRAIERFTADHGHPPTNPAGKIHYRKSIMLELLPYFEQVKIGDLWRSRYWVWIGQGISEYGFTTAQDEDYIIATFAKKNVKENWKFDAAHPEAGLYALRSADDFQNDLVRTRTGVIRGPIW